MADLACSYTTLVLFPTHALTLSLRVEHIGMPCQLQLLMVLTVIRLLCNTSGSGKTRLLFEGLCRHWGFYFVVAQGVDGMGARDLETMIDIMSRTSDWTPDIFNCPDRKGARHKNDNIAYNRISKVLLARWVVFEVFIEVSKHVYGGVLHNGAQRDWLLFQIHPAIQVNGMDPFLACITNCLQNVDSDLLETLRVELSPSVLGPAFSSQSTFFYVLDEAQVAGTQYIDAFADEDIILRRPVLCPIVRHLTSHPNYSVKLIVSGTGFSLEQFEVVLASGVAKNQSKWKVVHATGDFSDQDTQLAYISRYLPESFLLSDSGALLKTRVHEWLRGRYVALIKPRW